MTASAVLCRVLAAVSITTVVVLGGADGNALAQSPGAGTGQAPRTVLIGDMLLDVLPSTKDSNSPQPDFIETRYPWPDGVIPVEFAPEFSADFRTSFFWSCGVWTHFAAVRCVARTSETTYLKVLPDGLPCSSSVGVGPTGGERRIHLHPTDCHNFVMVHEIGHSLGLMHEHQRPDRDNYLTVVWDNINPAYHDAYRILDRLTSYGPYDFRSVMHYPWLSVGALSQNPTLLPKAGYEQYAKSMGGNFPSALDGAGLRAVYGGSATPFTPIVRPAPRDFFPAREVGNSVTFTWKPPDGYSLLTSYRLRVYAGSDTTPYLDIILPPDATSHTEVLRSGENTASLMGSDSAGFSASSFSVRWTVPEGSGLAPGAPTLTAAQVSTNPVTLSWVPGSGGTPTSYTILAGTTTGSSNIATIPVGTQTLVIGSAPVGTPLFVRVIASNAFGSAVSNEVSFTVGVTPPAAPTLVAGQTSVNPITLLWTMEAGGAPANYTLGAGTAPGASDLGEFSMGMATSVTASAPQGIAVYVRVTATNAAGSATSNEVTFTVAPSSAPLTPVLQQPVIAGASVTLTWSPSAPGHSYLLRARAVANGPVIAELPLVTPFVTVPSVPSGNYIVSVLASDGVGFSPESNSVVVVIP